MTTCHEVRQALLDLPVRQFGALEPHLDRCPRCAALADQVREAEAAIGDHLDRFAHQGDFDQAFARAIVEASPARPGARRFVGLAAALAVAALALAALSQGAREDVRGGSPPARVVDPTLLRSPAAPGTAEADPARGAPSAPRVAPAAPGSPSATPEETAPGADAAPQVAPEVPMDPTAAPHPSPAPVDPTAAPEERPGAPEDPPGALEGAGQTVRVVIDAARCGAPGALEQAASVGKLAPDQVGCLQDLFDQDDPIAGQLLLVDAWARNDPRGWERLARQYLTEIDPADADLGYKLALHLSKQLPDQADDAVKYATGAIEAAETLAPEVRVARIYTLQKLVAAARLSAWQQATATGADPTRVEAARVATREAAEAWLAFARENDLDRKAPGKVCEAVGGCSDR